MHYQALTPHRQMAILNERLAALEEHHFKLSVDMADAQALDNGEMVAQLAAQLTTVSVQLESCHRRITELPRDVPRLAAVHTPDPEGGAN